MIFVLPKDLPTVNSESFDAPIEWCQKTIPEIQSYEASFDTQIAQAATLVQDGLHNIGAYLKDPKGRNFWFAIGIITAFCLGVFIASDPIGMALAVTGALRLAFFLSRWALIGALKALVPLQGLVPQSKNIPKALQSQVDLSLQSVRTSLLSSLKPSLEESLSQEGLDEAQLQTRLKKYLDAPWEEPGIVKNYAKKLQASLNVSVSFEAISEQFEIQFAGASPTPATALTEDQRAPLLQLLVLEMSDLQEKGSATLKDLVRRLEDYLGFGTMSTDWATVRGRVPQYSAFQRLSALLKTANPTGSYRFCDLITQKIGSMPVCIESGEAINVENSKYGIYLVQTSVLVWLKECTLAESMLLSSPSIEQKFHENYVEDPFHDCITSQFGEGKFQNLSVDEFPQSSYWENAAFIEALEAVGKIRRTLSVNIHTDTRSRKQ